MPALARASRPKRHGGEAAPCRATPTCRLALRAAGCRPLLSCLPPLPPAYAPGSVGPAALCFPQPAPRRTRPGPRTQRVLGKTPARWTAAPKAARSAVSNAQDWQPHRTRDDTASIAMSASRTTRPMARQDARRRAASRRPSRAFLQPDRVRNADHGGCADRSKIPAVERRRIGDAEQEQLARPKLPALRPGQQRTA
jgi:hypothetical protein